MISRQSYTLIYGESAQLHVYSMMEPMVPDKKNAFADRPKSLHSCDF